MPATHKADERKKEDESKFETKEEEEKNEIKSYLAQPSICFFFLHSFVFSSHSLPLQLPERRRDDVQSVCFVFVCVSVVASRLLHRVYIIIYL